MEVAVKRYRRGLVTSLLEFLILSILERQDACGYDVIATICSDFQVLLSPGQVYPVINGLEASGVIRKEKDGRRIALRITPLGFALLKAWRTELDLMQLRLRNVASPLESAP